VSTCVAKSKLQNAGEAANFEGPFAFFIFIMAVITYAHVPLVDVPADRKIRKSKIRWALLTAVVMPDYSITDQNRSLKLMVYQKILPVAVEGKAR